jgi:heme/copper-type cytochrome/quinol oxidase subunit 2
MTPLSYTREETYARMAKKRVQLKGSVVIGLVLSVIAIVLLLVLFILWKRRQEVKKVRDANRRSDNTPILERP